MLWEPRLLAVPNKAVVSKAQQKAVFKEKTVFTEEEWQLLAEGYNELAKFSS